MNAWLLSMRAPSVFNNGSGVFNSRDAVDRDKEDSQMLKNGNNMSNHILPASSNLLGICFVILNFIKLSKIAGETIIDEVSAISIVFFLISSILSYMSIRSEDKSMLLEKTAEILFLVGLSLLAIISVMIALEIAR